jgi:hypothetical protein
MHDIAIICGGTIAGCASDRLSRDPALDHLSLRVEACDPQVRGKPSRLASGTSPTISAAAGAVEFPRFRGHLTAWGASPVKGAVKWQRRTRRIRSAC